MRAFLLLFIATVGFADPYPKNPDISVSHYIFKLELSDTSDEIAGEASVTVKFKKPVTSFDLNLIGKAEGTTGMEVTSVTLSGKPVEYTFKNNLISIKPTGANDEQTFVIAYKGIPADGLIISKNKFGDRSFFGDNWPDRGRNWLPSIDHTSYKSTVEFIITAPDHYEIIATGKLVDEKKISKKRKVSHWSESVPVSVKVMTIGVSEFAVQESGKVGNIPVTTWVYPQNQKEGFLDFSVAPKVLEYFQEYIGRYPFEKLAHVQSKTKFGGLENAGNIFYFENSVNGKNEREGLIAHETAHQWFGDSATEADWYHVWLSEGFATYFAALYMEHTYGPDKLKEIMTDTRKQIFKADEKNNSPIVDTTITDINKVLSIRTYQKAAWVLHMLRHEMGDENFQAGIREYYDTYKGKTALTKDFVAVMERYSKEDLKPFFQQWVFTGGHPRVDGMWYYEKHSIFIHFELTGTGPYNIPLEVLVNSVPQTIVLKPGKQTVQLGSVENPKKVDFDPNGWLLGEVNIIAK
ncbi:MAG: M1 family metallopeptidase [Bacteroidota bacterium]